jgi:hypothetical protein
MSDPGDVVLVAVLLGIATGWVARRRGRTAALWGLAGAALPLVALGALLLLPSRRPGVEDVLARVLREVRAAPGTTQDQLAIRAGVGLPATLEALLRLRERGEVRLTETGGTVSVAGHRVPEVRVHPTSPP